MGGLANLVVGPIVLAIIVYSFFRFIVTFGKGFCFMMSPGNRKLPRSEQWRRNNGVGAG